MARSKSKTNGKGRTPKAVKAGFELPDFQCPELTQEAKATGEIEKGDPARESESSSADGCVASEAIFRGSSGSGKVKLGKYLCPCGLPFRARISE